MNLVDCLAYLRLFQVRAGLARLALYALMLLWPSGWARHGHSNYPIMIVGIYATHGVFLMLAGGDPSANLSLIWFTGWSSAVQGGSWPCRRLTNRGKRAPGA